jgi:hypothetical protein
MWISATPENLYMTNGRDNRLGGKLEELELQRSKLMDQIRQSQSVLEAIEDKIETVKAQSKERLLKDERVDNRLVMQAHGAEKPDAEDTSFRLLTHINRSATPKERPASLITRELSEEEITVRPKEAELNATSVPTNNESPESQA